METLEPITVVSRVNNYLYLSGNQAIIDKVTKLTEVFRRQGISVYNTKYELRKRLQEQYGNSWFTKSQPAIDVLVDREYGVA